MDPIWNARLKERNSNKLKKASYHTQICRYRIEIDTEHMLREQVLNGHIESEHGIPAKRRSVSSPASIAAAAEAQLSHASLTLSARLSPCLQPFQAVWSWKTLTLAALCQFLTVQLFNSFFFIWSSWRSDVGCIWQWLGKSKLDSTPQKSFCIKKWEQISSYQIIHYLTFSGGQLKSKLLGFFDKITLTFLQDSSM